MFAFPLALAAPQGGQQPGKQLKPSVLKAEHKRLSLDHINDLYHNGSASNDVRLAGLFVHQHDNTEGEDMVFEVRSSEKDWLATSIVNKGLSGMYNGECGVVIDPRVVDVQCSYYADFQSWSTGCGDDDHPVDHLATAGWHDPGMVSKPRETPYPPDELMEMMEMSQELQSNKTARMKYKTARKDGDGEPTGGAEGAEGAEFWLGPYNEVLIDKAQYESNLPLSVAALFHVEGGDADGCSCIHQARAAMVEKYGSDAEHVLLLKFTPGAETAFADSPECTAGQQSEQAGCLPNSQRDCVH